MASRMPWFKKKENSNLGILPKTGVKSHNSSRSLRLIPFMNAKRPLPFRKAAAAQRRLKDPLICGFKFFSGASHSRIVIKFTLRIGTRVGIPKENS